MNLNKSKVTQKGSRVGIWTQAGDWLQNPCFQLLKCIEKMRKWELGQCRHFPKTRSVSSNYPLSFPSQFLLTFSHSTPQHVHIEWEGGKLGVIISNQRQGPHLPYSHYISSRECWIHCLLINKTGKNFITQYILFGFLFFKKSKVLVLKEFTIHFYVNTKQRNARGRMENESQMNDADKGRARKSQQGAQRICLVRVEKDFWS